VNVGCLLERFQEHGCCTQQGLNSLDFLKGFDGVPWPSKP
jgi:hypothetical protein